MSTDLQRTGAASEFLVAHYLAARGFDVFFPHGNTRADLVYEDGDSTIRVQVKTGTRVKTGPHEYEQARLRSRGVYNVADGRYKNYAPYSTTEIDELWVVGTHLWCFPSHIVAGLPSISLGGSTGKSRKKKAYDPDAYIVVRGSWNKPVRHTICKY